MSDTPKRNSTDDDDDELLPQEERALVEALARSVRPEPLSNSRHEAILARVGLAPANADEDDPSREPDEHEIQAARAFAEALDTGATHPDVELARALAFASRSDETARRNAVAASERALSLALARPRNEAKRKLLLVSFGAAGSALALAASIILAIGLPAREPEPRPELLLSRSLAPLLGPEASELSASARLDRIANARSRDFRSNRYAAWGVR